MSETLDVHPLAEKIPAMTSDEFVDLTSDIEANGLREPIWLYEGKILDGRHRYMACVKLNLKAETRLYEGDNPLAFVISMNIHRRHLTAEAKRELIAELLKANPQASDRAIAATAHVSPTTVGEVRKSTVQSGQFERVGLDGKKRKAKNGRRRQTPLQSKRQVEEFKETWEGFDSWQKRAFVKGVQHELVELLEEVSNEADLTAEPVETTQA